MVAPVSPAHRRSYVERLTHAQLAHYWFRHEETNFNILGREQLHDGIAGCDPLALAIECVEDQPLPRRGDLFWSSFHFAFATAAVSAATWFCCALICCSRAGSASTARASSVQDLGRARIRAACALSARFRDAAGMILRPIAASISRPASLPSALEATAHGHIDFRGRLPVWRSARCDASS